MSLRGEVGWQATYQKAFGKERWPGLHRALRGPINHVALLNRFAPPATQDEARAAHQLRDHATIPLVCAVSSSAKTETSEAEAPADVGPELTPCYFLDGASAIAALALDVAPGDIVLDLCAAPGGKSLLLATMLFAGSKPEQGPGRLVSNEPSRPRAQRLQRVLASFLPGELLAAGGDVYVTTADATATPPTAIQRLGPFDRVLLDAPCSSDRHLVRQGGTALARWAAGAVKANAERQLDLLRTASLLVRAGGLVVYSTCALAEQENDGVVAKFLKKAGHTFQPEPFVELSVAEGESPAEFPETSLLPAGAELTEFGALILPDRTPFGPMYICRLRRL